jgi:hypothetical protein
MTVTVDRGAVFEELVFGSDAYAELLGPGCTGMPWARVPCSPGLAMGGEVTFRYGERDASGALVRLSRQARRELEARPTLLRIVVHDAELRSWPLTWAPGTRPVVLLPGDSLTCHL